jgi:hypothetical protein
MRQFGPRQSRTLLLVTLVPATSMFVHDLMLK